MFDVLSANLMLYMLPEFRHGRQRRFLPRIDDIMSSALNELLKGRIISEHLALVENAENPSDEVKRMGAIEQDKLENGPDSTMPNDPGTNKSPPLKPAHLSVTREDLVMISMLIELLTEKITKLQKREMENVERIRSLQANLPHWLQVDERGLSDKERRQMRRKLLQRAGFSEREIDAKGDLSKITPVELYIMELTKSMYETSMRVYKEKMGVGLTEIEVTMPPALFGRAMKMMQDSQRPLTLKVRNGTITDLM